MADAKAETVPTTRFGPRGHGRTKLLRAAVQTVEMAPTHVRAGTRSTAEYKLAQWVIVKPSWCTSYDVAFYRLVEVYDKEGQALYQRWVKDETIDQTEDLVYYQPCDGQDVQCAIVTITGVPDDETGFDVLVTGSNRPS